LYNDKMPQKLVIHSWFRIAFVSLSATVALIVICNVVDHFATGDPLIGHPIEWVNDIVTGIVGGAMLFKLQAKTRHQSILMKSRLRIIEVANNEINQALQVMANSCTSGSKEQYALLRASDHIHWVLEEILPLENTKAIIQNIDAIEQPATSTP
jgi:hypothetical protein